MEISKVNLKHLLNTKFKLNRFTFLISFFLSYKCTCNSQVEYTHCKTETLHEKYSRMDSYLSEETVKQVDAVKCLDAMASAASILDFESVTRNELSTLHSDYVSYLHKVINIEIQDLEAEKSEKRRKDIIQNIMKNYRESEFERREKYLHIISLELSKKLSPCYNKISALVVERNNCRENFIQCLGNIKRCGAEKLPLSLEKQSSEIKGPTKGNEK